MERIRLSEEEKAALRRLSVADASAWPPALRRQLGCACKGLACRGLACSYGSEAEGLAEAVITDFGANYLLHNPSLRNPVDWAMTGAVAACVAAAAAIAALLVACVRV